MCKIPNTIFSHSVEPATYSSRPGENVMAMEGPDTFCDIKFSVESFINPSLNIMKRSANLEIVHQMHHFRITGCFKIIILTTILHFCLLVSCCGNGLSLILLCNVFKGFNNFPVYSLLTNNSS